MMKESEFLELRRLRQLEFYSDHLTAVDVTAIRNQEKNIINWLWSNTQGRFWVGELYRDQSWKFLVCFEIPYEATFFSLKFLSAYSAE